MMKKCAWCGKEFDAPPNRRVYCTDECSRKAHVQRCIANQQKKRAKERQPQFCVICGKEFESKCNLKVCNAECRAIRDREKNKKFYETYKELAKQKKQERARLKGEQLVEFEHRELDGKVLHKAEMTVDEYNRTHGTNYSYGQYVYYVESKGVK